MVFENLSDKKEWTVEDNLTACCQRFAQKLEEAFVFEMRAGHAFIKESFQVSNPTDEMMKDLTEFQFRVMIEYAMGTIAALLAHYGSTDPVFEEYVTMELRKKFSVLRTMPLPGKNESN